MAYFCTDTKETAETYPDYLKTDHWKNLRQVVFSNSRQDCSKCGKPLSSRGFEIHHLNYDNVGNEQESDLAVLCRKCHEMTHKVELLEKIMAKRELKKLNPSTYVSPTDEELASSLKFDPECEKPFSADFFVESDKTNIIPILKWLYLIAFSRGDKNTDTIIEYNYDSMITIVNSFLKNKYDVSVKRIPDKD